MIAFAIALNVAFAVTVANNDMQAAIDGHGREAELASDHALPDVLPLSPHARRRAVPRGERAE